MAPPAFPNYPDWVWEDLQRQAVEKSSNQVCKSCSIKLENTQPWNCVAKPASTKYDVKDLDTYGNLIVLGLFILVNLHFIAFSFHLVNMRYYWVLIINTINEFKFL